MAGRECYKDINENLNRQLAERKVLIAVHRGSWGGNIIENTITAYEACRAMGGDMFEIDLSNSADGVLYACHDGGEDRLFGIRHNVKAMTSAEIDMLSLRNCIGEPSLHHLERFSDVLAHFTHGELFNVDRAWWFLPKMHEVLQQYPNAVYQAVIKTPVKKELLDFFRNCPVKYMYMPIVYNMDDVRLALSCPDINIVGAETIVQDPGDELFLDENIRWMKSQGLYIWANAISLSGLKAHWLYGGLDDDLALTAGAAESWGKIMDKGVEVIQTDWPVQLSKYRETYMAQRCKTSADEK